MQFSVFDLQRQQLRFQPTNQKDDIQLIELTNPGENVLGLLLNDDFSYVELLYDLTESNFDPLERFSGERELIFSIGGEEQLATITPGGVVRFKNTEHLASLDSSDYLTIQLYQNNDAANILWEFTLGTGLDVISSSDQGSAAVKSFIICDSTDINICQLQQPITVRIVGDFADDAQVQWTIEALEYTPPSERDTPVNADEQYAYGQIKTIRQGGNVTNVPGAGTGTGRFNDPWVSFEQNFNFVRAISFLPDVSGIAAEHEPAVYRINGSNSCTGNQYDRSCNIGTNLSDIAKHNPHVGYKIIANITTAQGTTTLEKTVRMDHKDVLRQEFINHKQSIRTLSSSQAASIPIPERNDFALTNSLPGFVEIDGAWYDYPYDYILEYGMQNIWNVVSSNFATHRTQTYNGLTVPGNALRISSGFRNPERNERVGGARDSKHLRGRALDLAFAGTLGNPSQERGILFGSLWQMIEGGTGDVAQADWWQLERGTTKVVGRGEPLPLDENGDGIPDSFLDIGHLHVHTQP